MTADLIRAKALLKDDVTCALVGGGRAVTSTQRGVKPLLAWLGGDHRGFAAADKVVGRAAAFLYVLLGVSSLYAAVLSEPALAVLRAHHIPVEYDTLAARIVDRTGTGLCPMESAVMGEDDPCRAREKIEQTCARLAAKNNNV